MSISASVRCLIPFSLIVLAGCGSGIHSTANSTLPVASALAYHSYGDSITVGATLVSSSTQAYPVLVARDRGLTLTNNANGGDQSCDVPTRQIFAKQDSPTIAASPKYSLLIGTNDAFFRGLGSYESIYTMCQLASIAWLGLPLEFKTLATGRGFAHTGPGSLDTTNHWNAWVTGAAGATVSFTITTTVVGPLYAWPRIDDLSDATYSYALDGKTLGTGSARTTPTMLTINGTTNSLSLLRLPNVPAGTHTLTFRQTNTGSPGIGIVGIASPSAHAAATLPQIFVGTVLFMERGSGAPCDLSDAICQHYIQDIQANVALLAGDGLDVRIFDTRQYMFGNSSEMNDPVHPNATGQIELSHALESVF